MLKSRTILMIPVILAAFLFSSIAPSPRTSNPQPPDEPVKLIFIHHSCGENWLTDGYGNLGTQLGQNNYFVSDTNYGWGPDAIGDRTDIPDWLEWFRSDRTDQIMQALYNENGQLSDYFRPLADPGGENTIVMFKSCFPNSELSGNPGDPPGSYAELSVSGAKYVYNELLAYFAARPDKFFIVITAPPVSSRANAQNARAFNNWLVEDWLSENNYPLENVAVFDFYNVLTGKEAHHRYLNGKIEHVTVSQNTVYYPSEDDHPSEIGSRKATEEFIPLLNYYYQRWQASASAQAADASTQTGDATGEKTTEESIGSPAISTAVATTIDNFETDNSFSVNGWELFSGNPSGASMQCAATAESAFQGAHALQIELNVEVDDWAVCSLIFTFPQDWSESEGVIFMLHAHEAGSAFDVNLYSGSEEALQTYTRTIKTTPESLEGWVPVTLLWEDFRRVEWEENANSPFSPADLVSGIAFGVNSGNAIAISIDDLSLIEKAPTSDQPSEIAE